MYSPSAMLAHCCERHRSQIDRATRRLHDHKRAQGCAAVVATDVSSGELDRKHCQKLRPFNPSASQRKSI